MYAIVKSGGKQYRVERGQRLLVERLAAEEGASVALEPILFRSEQAVLDKDGLAKVRVTAKVIAHERGQKLRVFKFKPKRGYKRRNGHRQSLTRIEVTELELGSSRAKAEPSKGTEGKASPAKTHAAPKAKPAGAPKAKPAADRKAKPATAPKAKPAPAPKAKAPAKPRSKAQAADASKPRGAKAKPSGDAPARKRAKPKPGGED